MQMIEVGGVPTHFDPTVMIIRLRNCAVRTDTVDDPDLRIALALIVEQRLERLYVEDIAKALRISRRTLERRFRDQLGITVRRAIVLVQFEIALYLLKHSNLSITAVSVEAGFSSPSRMSNVFLRELGCSPRQLRQSKVAALSKTDRSSSTKNSIYAKPAIDHPPSTADPMPRPVEESAATHSSSDVIPPVFVEFAHPEQWDGWNTTEIAAKSPRKDVAPDEVLPFRVATSEINRRTGASKLFRDPPQ